MELIVKGSFHRDVSLYKDKRILSAIYDVIQETEKAKTISVISNIKKLRNYRTHYRIKVVDVYRIGLVIRKDKVWFVCFGHRSKFYQRFP